MLRTALTITLVGLFAIDRFSLAVAEGPNETGSKQSPSSKQDSKPKEITFDLAKGLRLDMVFAAHEN